MAKTKSRRSKRSQKKKKNFKKRISGKLNPIALFKMNVMYYIFEKGGTYTEMIQYNNWITIGMSDVIETLGDDFFEYYYLRGYKDGDTLNYDGEIHRNEIEKYMIIEDHADLYLKNGKIIPVRNFEEVGAQCFKNCIPIFYYGTLLNTGL